MVGGLDHFLFFHILGMSSSQVTKSQFSEGQVYYQPVYIQLSHVKTSMFGKNCLIFRKRHQTFPNRWVCLKQGIPYPQFQWMLIILVYLISNPNDGQVVVISYPMAYPHVHIQRLKQCFSSASIVIYGDLLKIHKSSKSP